MVFGLSPDDDDDDDNNNKVFIARAWTIRTRKEGDETEGGHGPLARPPFTSRPPGGSVPACRCLARLQLVALKPSEKASCVHRALRNGIEPYEAGCLDASPLLQYLG